MNRLITGFLLFCCLVFVFGKNIDLDDFEMDYFFSRSRTAASKCEDSRFNRQCGIKCGGKYTCAFEKCFCFMHVKHSKHPETAKLNQKKNNVFYVKDSYELNDSVEKIKTLHLREVLDFPEPSETHPVLRHHIAHFCENLDTARKCIRSCMNIGKPAFCGKDHICYCGHKYSAHDKRDPKVNPADVYAEFKDLYAKYFGPTEGTSIVKLPGSGEKSSGEISSDEKSSGEKGSGEKRSGEKSSGEKSSGEKSSGEKSSGEKGSGEKGSGEKGSGEKSSSEKMSGEKVDPNQGKNENGNQNISA